jgi:protein gp37
VRDDEDEGIDPLGCFLTVALDLRHWSTNQIRAHGLGLGGELMASTKIEWTDAVWNPIRGCSRVSEGCRNCYAERQAIRQSGPGGKYEGLVRIHITPPRPPTPERREPRWTGKVVFDEEKLKDPLGWKKPRRIFVNSMSDLFHERVEDNWIHEVIAIMAVCPQHTFQILTKRPTRMREFLSTHYVHISKFRNIWWGVSVEDQATADERIPLLLETPAAVRWISAEPLLGSIDLRFLQPNNEVEIDALRGTHGVIRPHRGSNPSIDWVVVGGESGPGARPMHPDWARLLRDQCQTASVPFFFKQWGEFTPYGRGFVKGSGCGPRTNHTAMFKVGKKAAGRELDGTDWSQYPEARNGHS